MRIPIAGYWNYVEEMYKKMHLPAAKPLAIDLG